MPEEITQKSHEVERLDGKPFNIDSRDPEYIGRRLHAVYNSIRFFGENIIVEFHQKNSDIIPGLIGKFCKKTGLYCDGIINHDWNTHILSMEIGLPPSEIKREKRNKMTFVFGVGVAATVAAFVGLTPRNTGMKDFSAITYAEGVEQARIGVKDGVVRCLEGDAGEIKLGDTVYGWPRNDNRRTKINGNNPDNTITLREENNFLAEKTLRLRAQVSDEPNLLCEKDD